MDYLLIKKLLKIFKGLKVIKGSTWANFQKFTQKSFKACLCFEPLPLTLTMYTIKMTLTPRATT